MADEQKKRRVGGGEFSIDFMRREACLALFVLGSISVLVYVGTLFGIRRGEVDNSLLYLGLAMMVIGLPPALFYLRKKDDWDREVEEESKQYRQLKMSNKENEKQ